MMKKERKDRPVSRASKGINKGVIDDRWDVDAEDLAKYIKARDGDPLEEIGKHQLQRIYKSPKSKTVVGENTIDNVAVFKKGSASEGWGWENFVDQNHNEQIKNAFGLVDDNKAVKEMIRDALKRGTVDPKDNLRILYNPLDSDKTLRVVLSSDSSGSIQDAYPVSP